MVHNIKTRKKEEGFALLLTIIIVAVLISISLTILDVSIKQARLSSNAKDSELAFQAASAGMECARYWRGALNYEVNTGENINPSCFSVAAGNTSPTTLVSNSNGDSYRYRYRFTWGAGVGVRCTQVVMVTASSTPDGAGVTIPAATLNNLNTFNGAWPGGNKLCEAGSQCTIVAVRGYNKSCSNIGGYGVVQREVLLQY